MLMPRKVILLVEDDADAASGMQLALECENYMVVWAQDSCEAMAWLTANEKPILIITDYRMKKNSQTANGDVLAEWTSLKQIPLLMISALPDEAKAACKLRGVSVPIIAKPFSIDPFIACIHKLVNPGQLEMNEISS